MCAGELLLELRAGVIHDWARLAVLLLVCESGGRPVVWGIFYEWRVHDFIARWNWQAELAVSTGTLG